MPTHQQNSRLCIKPLFSGYVPDKNIFEHLNFILERDSKIVVIGENGTGKSTIIEALKFATIGKLQKETITFPDIWGKDKTESKVSLTFQSYDRNNYVIELSPSISKSSIVSEG